MAWIKRNLLFVVGLVVAVGLLAFGVFYLLGNMSAAEQAKTDLETKNKELDDLVKREVYPNQKNVDLAKAEQVRIEKFKTASKARFQTFQPLTNLDNASFKSLLESTIAGLEREADRSGVKLPTPAAGGKYSFTFESQRKDLQLPQASLAPLASQLQDLSDVCHILFDAKVHSLASLRRSVIMTNEVAGTGDLLTKKVVTNKVAAAVSFPYEVSFQCFSSELAGVLAGFVNSPQSFLIKTVNVERGTIESATPAMALTSPVATPGLPGGMDPRLAARYGMAMRPQAVPQPVAAPTAAKPGEAPLDDRPLRVTLGLELVKLLPAQAAAAPAKAPAKPAAEAPAQN